MSSIKQDLSLIKANWMGASVGGVGAYFLAKKIGNVENKFALGAIAVGGVILGAMAQAKMGAKAPTAVAVVTKQN